MKLFHILRNGLLTSGLSVILTYLRMCAWEERARMKTWSRSHKAHLWQGCSLNCNGTEDNSSARGWVGCSSLPGCFPFLLSLQAHKVLLLTGLAFQVAWCWGNVPNRRYNPCKGMPLSLSLNLCFSFPWLADDILIYVKPSLRVSWSPEVLAKLKSRGCMSEDGRSYLLSRHLLRSDYLQDEKPINEPPRSQWHTWASQNTCLQRSINHSINPT